MADPLLVYVNDSSGNLFSMDVANQGNVTISTDLTKNQKALNALQTALAFLQVIAGATAAATSAGLPIGPFSSGGDTGATGATGATGSTDPTMVSSGGAAVPTPTPIPTSGTTSSTTSSTGATGATGTTSTSATSSTTSGTTSATGATGA